MNVVPQHIMLLAVAAHEANRAYCWALGQEKGSFSELTTDQQLAVLHGVQACLSGAGPEQLWESWRTSMLHRDWEYGPVLDPVRRQHPGLVKSWLDLPEVDRRKDVIFHRTVLVVHERWIP